MPNTVTINPPITDVRIQKWSDIEAPVFTEIPEVVKDLGLADQGAKLMDEQNRMIRMKHTIQVALTEGADLFPSKDPEPKDPFDFTVTETPDIGKMKRQKMENALRISALYNQQYRECAKDFLDAAIPEVKKKKNNLQHDISSLELELESIKAGYKKKIREKQKELDKLMKGCREVVDRFYRTDTGTAANGGHIPCERPEGIAWSVIKSAYHDGDECLEGMRGAIDKIDHPFDDAPSVDPQYRSSFRDGSGSASQFGGDMRYSSDGNGLKDFVKSIFS